MVTGQNLIARTGSVTEAMSDVEDIESELFSSAREAGVTCFAGADLDVDAADDSTAPHVSRPAPGR